MKKNLSVSAFFPSYNEWGTIASMVAATSSILDSINIKHEIIVIDNGSTDYSDIIFRDLKKRYKNLRVIRHEINQGYGGALKTGFAEAKNEIIFYTDADAQYDIKELKTALETLTDDIDVVTGYKINRADEYHRYLLGTLYQMFVRRLFKLETIDPDCDFRVIRKKVFDKVKLESNTGIICVELMKKIEDNGFKIKQIPIKHFARAFGKSQFFRIKQIVKTFYSLFKLWRKLNAERKKNLLLNNK